MKDWKMKMSSYKKKIKNAHGLKMPQSWFEKNCVDIIGKCV